MEANYAESKTGHLIALFCTNTQTSDCLGSQLQIVVQKWNYGQFFLSTLTWVRHNRPLFLIVF